MLRFVYKCAKCAPPSLPDGKESVWKGKAKLVNHIQSGSFLTTLAAFTALRLAAMHAVFSGALAKAGRE